MMCKRDRNRNNKEIEFYPPNCIIMTIEIKDFNQTRVIQAMRQWTDLYEKGKEEDFLEIICEVVNSLQQEEVECKHNFMEQLKE